MEQSLKLIELGLSKETADMSYSEEYFGKDKDGNDEWYWKLNACKFVDVEGIIPAWSLSALLEVMPKKETPYIMYLNEPPFDTEYRWQCGLFDYIGSPGSSPIEAAFQMVCWLLENGYIEEGGEQ